MPSSENAPSRKPLRKHRSGFLHTPIHLHRSGAAVSVSITTVNRDKKPHRHSDLALGCSKNLAVLPLLREDDQPHL